MPAHTRDRKIHSNIGTLAIGNKTFGHSEFIRVLFPPARMTAVTAVPVDVAEDESGLFKERECSMGYPRATDDQYRLDRKYQKIPDKTKTASSMASEMRSEMGFKNASIIQTCLWFKPQPLREEEKLQSRKIQKGSLPSKVFIDCLE